tara:strand:- start:882 stop:2051 length:1170 start_codon:yes stop_codon:yes gene_type:complete
MFRPQIQKTKTLVVIALINIFLVIFISQSSTYKEYDSSKYRYKSVEFMSTWIELIKNNNNIKIQNEDYYKSGLIGLEKSEITTLYNQDNIEDILDSKIITTSSNFAAFITLLFEEIGLNHGDSIAVSMTGSIPGANLAMLAACKSMGLYPVILSSVGSSPWGANRIDFAWPHIEKYLYNRNLIPYQSLAVSIGGENNLGANLDDKGIEIIEDIIQYTDKLLINEPTLEENINKKINLFENINNYKVFVNIGGGSTSLGAGAGKNFINGGIISPILKDEIQEIYYNFEEGELHHVNFKKSLAYKFLDNDIPLLNIKNINTLVSKYGMHYLKDRNSNKVNKGLLFYEVAKFNVKIIWFALIVSILISLAVGIYSHLEIKERMKNNEIDSIL